MLLSSAIGLLFKLHQQHRIRGYKRWGYFFNLFVIFVAVMYQLHILLRFHISNYSSNFTFVTSTPFHMAGGGGEGRGGGLDSTHPQIVFFINSVWETGEPQSSLKLPKI